LADKFRIHW